MPCKMNVVWKQIQIDSDSLYMIAVFSNGMPAYSIKHLEMAALNSMLMIRLLFQKKTIEQCTSRKSLLYDKKVSEHYT